MHDIGLLRATLFADCDPAFFPDDEEDPEELRPMVEELEQLLDFAEVKADLLYEEVKTKRAENVRSHVAKAHLIIQDILEDL